MTLEHKILGQLNVDSLVSTPNPLTLFAEGVDGFNTISSSTDGITWELSTTVQSLGQASGFASDGNVFVTIGYYTADVSYSTDLINWTATPLNGTNNGMNALIYGDAGFVGVNSGTNYFYSTDGITWTATTPASAGTAFAATYGNSKYISIKRNTDVANISTDGINWTTATVSASADWRGVSYYSGQYIAVANNTTVASRSTDGITWTAITMPATANWRDVAYGSNGYIAVAYGSSNFAQSTDGITWQSITAPGTYNWNGIEFGNGVYVVATYLSGGSRAISTDGVTWSLITNAGANQPGPLIYIEDLTRTDIEYFDRTIYTVPENTETLISSIFISNTSASSDTYDFAVVPSGETLSDIHYIRKSVELPANDFHNIETKLTLSAGDQIVAKSLYNNIQVNIFGVEKS